MRPPILGDSQVNCGPDWTDWADAAGRVASLATPLGVYDLSAVAARLPADQQPDVVVCLVDASRRNLPGNLGAFRCPRVLLVADTHHMSTPLTGLLRYAATEPYDRIVLLYDRHHAEFFRSAGIRNLYWFPGLTFPHSDESVRTARRAERERRIAFVGQAGRFHPRRQRLLGAMAARGIAVEQQLLPQDDALGFYGASWLGFNASLNGDLNLRVFEIMAAGAALLTDRLSVESGLEALFSDGRELLLYGRVEELAERAVQALARPAETQAVGAAGARWFDEHFSEGLRRAAFQALVFAGTPVPEFAFPETETGSVFFGGTPALFPQGLKVYEEIQETHRSQEVVHVGFAAGAPDDFRRICTTLPRVECGADVDGSPMDLAVASRAQVLAGVGTRAARLWCWDAGMEVVPSLAQTLFAAGFSQMEAETALFRRTQAAVATGAAVAKHVLLYTDDPDSGGVAQYNHAVLIGLVRAGFRVSCVQSYGDNPLLREQQECGVRFHWIEYHTGREFARTLDDSAVAERAFGADRPDLVIFSDCWPVSNMAAREAALRLGIPYVVVVGYVGAYLARSFVDRLPDLARQYEQAKSVVAVSQHNLRLLHQLFGLPADRGEVIHYGRPERFFSVGDPVVRNRLRAEVGLPAEAVVCFTAARLAEVKGFEFQIEAAVRLLREPAGRHLYFVWAGEGDLREALIQAIQKRGLSGRVKLLGHRWDVADWFDVADVFVLLSRLEGLPLAIMEAMAKGLPVIATAVSGIPEELGDTGKLLPEPKADPGGVVGGLVETIRRWCLDPELRRSEGRRCRVRAETMFREEQMIAATLRLVLQALEAAMVQGPEAAAAALLAEARELSRQDRFGPAFAKVLAALEKAPRCIDAHVLLGQLASKRPNGAAMAAKSFRAALALSPGNLAVEVLLATALLEQGRRTEAAVVMDKLLASHPRNPQVLILQAKLCAG